MSDNIILMTIVKGVPIYFLALFLSRSIGKKIITKMNFFDFVMGVSMGSMIANAVIDKDNPVVSEVTALTLFTGITVLVSYLSTKSFWFRKIVSGQPIVVIDSGMILDQNLKQLRITINELLMKLREKDIFNLDDVEYAILERDGKLSVLKKADKLPVTTGDMSLKVKGSSLLKDIIMDGCLIEDNLELAGIDEKWVNSELQKQQISHLSEVFYAGIDDSKVLKISKKQASRTKYGLK
ncbi:MAG TPA: DUF421 domain-containing protein [Firmicutes bacterium]|nr:DUF421 domain-containing protein [Bacillota bacterium]